MLLVIDNYDSFTYNVVRYLVESGARVEVRRNNDVTLGDIEKLKPSALVISPGPCTPNEAGISLSAIQHFAHRLPILGVCLGHQALGQVYGAKVVRAAKVMHGKTSLLHHASTGLFEHLPNPFQVARYHSLILENASMPACLQVDAWCGGDSDEPAAREIMAISHTDLPLHGVQFHPEAILSEQGHALFEQFLVRYQLC